MKIDWEDGNINIVTETDKDAEEVNKGIISRCKCCNTLLLHKEKSSFCVIMRNGDTEEEPCMVWVNKCFLCNPDIDPVEVKEEDYSILYNGLKTLN